MNRVYVLKYKFNTTFYSIKDGKFEDRVEYFSRFERDEFMKRYKKLKEDAYFKDVVAYYGELQEVSVEVMLNQI